GRLHRRRVLREGAGHGVQDVGVSLRLAAHLLGHHQHAGESGGVTRVLRAALLAHAVAAVDDDGGATKDYGHGQHEQNHRLAALRWAAMTGVHGYVLLDYGQV